MGCSPAAAVEDADVLFFWFLRVASFIAVASARTRNADSGGRGVPTWVCEDARVQRREALGLSATLSMPRFRAPDAHDLTHSAVPRPEGSAGAASRGISGAR